MVTAAQQAKQVTQVSTYNIIINNNNSKYKKTQLLHITDNNMRSKES
jgi:hypothetical protein